MTPEEFQQAIARAKERAAFKIDTRRTLSDTMREAQTRFSLPEPRPFQDRREIESGMREFITQQQAIPRARLPAPAPPTITTETRTLPTQSFRGDEPPAPAQQPVTPQEPGGPGEGEWRSVTDCDGATFDVWTQNYVAPP